MQKSKTQNSHKYYTNKFQKAQRLQQTGHLAEAERTSSILRGEGDASKNKILGDAYSLDEEFFDFLRTMQACKETFGDTEMSMVIAPGEVCKKFFGEIDKEN